MSQITYACMPAAMFLAYVPHFFKAPLVQAFAQQQADTKSGPTAATALMSGSASAPAVAVEHGSSASAADPRTAMINNPRDFTARAAAVNPVVARALAAHENQLECLPWFFGSILFAILAGVPRTNIDIVALIYTLGRVIYIPAYIGGTAAWHGGVRSTLWIAGWVACLYLLCHAAAVAPKFEP